MVSPGRLIMTEDSIWPKTPPTLSLIEEEMKWREKFSEVVMRNVRCVGELSSLHGSVTTKHSFFPSSSFLIGCPDSGNK